MTGLLVGTVFLCSVFFQTVLGFSALVAGLAFLPPALAMTVGTHVAGRLAARLAPRTIAALGLALTGTGALLLSTASGAARFTPDLLPGLLVLGLGTGMVFVAVSVSAMAGIPTQHAGMTSGFLVTGHEVGAALGVAVLSAVAADCREPRRAGRSRRRVLPRVHRGCRHRRASSRSWRSCGCRPRGAPAGRRCTCTDRQKFRCVRRGRRRARRATGRTHRTSAPPCRTWAPRVSLLSSSGDPVSTFRCAAEPALLDSVVICAGQAGLPLGHPSLAAGPNFLLLDYGAGIGNPGAPDGPCCGCSAHNTPRMSAATPGRSVRLR